MSIRRTPRSAEVIVSIILQLGVISSALIILIGLVSFFMHSNLPGASYRQYTTSTYSFPHSMSSIRDAIRSNQSLGFIELGILLLILTPTARVTASVVFYLRQHDKPMTFVTGSVLFMLICSFLLGVAVR